MSDRHATKPPARRYCSLAHAAEYLGISEKTVRRMIASGEISGYRLGSRLIRIDLDEVDALLKPISDARRAGVA